MRLGGFCDPTNINCSLSAKANFSVVVAAANSRSCLAMLTCACAVDDWTSVNGFSAIAMDRNISSSHVMPDVCVVRANNPCVSKRVNEAMILGCDVM